MLPRVNHVAIAVTDLPHTLRFYKKTFGLAAGPIRELKSQGVRVASIATENVTLEFVAPLNKSSPISKFLMKRGEGLHHIAIQTRNLNEEVKRIRAKRIRTLSPSPKPGYDGEPIIFLHPKDTRGVLIELEQARRK